MKITYYVAMSVDGFMATVDGSVSWLDDVDHAGEDYGYGEMFSSIDGMLMGRNTFDFAHSVGWPYGEMPCWVWSNRMFDSPNDNVVGTEQEPYFFVDEKKKNGFKHFWLVGGGSLAGQFLRDDLITDFNIAMIPVVLGAGIPLFDSSEVLSRLELTSSRSYKSGVIQNQYRLNKHAPDKG